MRWRSSRTRQWPAIRRPLLGVLLALVAVFGLTEAAASQLNLGPGSAPPVTGRWARCSGNQLTVTITGSTAAVSGINASACSGRTLRLFVRSGAPTLTSSATISGATATLTLPSAVTTAAGVAATIGTWAVPVSFSVVQPNLPAVSCVSLDNPSLTCSAQIQNITAWGWPTTNEFNAAIVVTSTSTTPVRWQVTMNFSSSSWPFLAKKVDDNQGGLVKVSSSACSATPRLVAVRGTTSWGNYHLVSSTSNSSMQIHAFPTGTGGLLNCS